MKNMIRAAIATTVFSLVSGIYTPQSAKADWVRTDHVEHISAYRPLNSNLSWVNILPGSNIRNPDFEVIGTTEGTWMIVPAVNVYRMADGELWIQIEFQLPGSVSTYGGIVHESRIDGFHFTDPLEFVY